MSGIGLARSTQVRRPVRGPMSALLGRASTDKVRLLWPAICLLLPVLYGQESHLLRGTVRDESGAVLLGVRVDISCHYDAFRSSVVTDGFGVFVFRNVPEPPCEIRAGKDQFDSFSLSIDADSMLRHLLASLAAEMSARGW